MTHVAIGRSPLLSLGLPVPFPVVEDRHCRLPGAELFCLDNLNDVGTKQLPRDDKTSKNAN